MSVLSSKHATEAEQGHGLPLAWVVAAARSAAPMVLTAGMAAQNGARSVGTWAAPRVNGARTWTAPRIEGSGLAIRDTVAPKIYDVLAATARRVDVTAPGPEASAPRRHWPWVVAGTAALAATGAAAAVVFRRRKKDGTGGVPGPAAGADSGPQTAANGQQPADVAGGAAEDEASRPSPEN